jgi:phosphate starvation-inducible protein PhoH and related proteins
MSKKSPRGRKQNHNVKHYDYREVYNSRPPKEEKKVYERKTRPLVAKTTNQQLYMDCIDASDITFCLGPAGSGKTHIAIGKAVQFIKAGLFDEDKVGKRIVLVRPLVEVGKTMGFLPGDIEAKMNPYLRPLYDEISYFFTSSDVELLRKEDRIEIASLEHMRGRTLRNSIVILDEAQNATKEQMKMFLTRLGKGSKLIITGDSEQSDLPLRPVACVYYAEKFEGVEGISVVRLGRQDIVRHPTVARLVEVGLD